MTTLRRYPDYSFWITGVPKSLSAKKTENYRARIQAAAAAEITEPLQSPRIDIDIIFAAKNRNLRADVDNVAKPVLDALKGVVYMDDRQVRSVKVVALPLDDPHRIQRATPTVTDRLYKAGEFLINVYTGLTIDVWLVEAKRPTAKISVKLSPENE
jgi:Holliday junction resolvase RusA-like endonuclease